MSEMSIKVTCTCGMNPVFVEDEDAAAAAKNDHLEWAADNSETYNHSVSFEDV